MTPEEILDAGKAILMKKARDYSTNVEVDRTENFDRSGIVGSWFTHPTHRSFAILIGTKLARLGALLSSGRESNNEAIIDSFIDLCNYSALFGYYVTGKRSSPEDVKPSAEAIVKRNMPQEYDVRVVHGTDFKCNYCMDSITPNTEPVVTHIATKVCYHTKCFTDYMLAIHGVKGD